MHVLHEQRTAKYPVLDPMSHRIIEKRRRDRMNNCLADLSRLIPNTYLKKGRGRIEKTEIIEMAIRHLKHLQAHSCKDPNNCEVMKSAEQDHKRHYRLGFQECMSETLRFLVEIEGLYSGDGVCLRLVNHLQKHYEKAAGGMPYSGNVSTVPEHPYEENRGTAMDVEGPSLPSQTQYEECASTGASNRVSPVLTSSANIKTKDSYGNKEHMLRDNHLKAGTLCENSGKYMCEDTVNNGISQLREMLQNPGIPIERIRSNSLSNGHIVTQSNSLPWMATLNPGIPIYTTSASHKTEEVYKYKNNMKERFNADLHYYTCSPANERKFYEEKHRCNETASDNAVTYSPGNANPPAPNFEIKTNSSPVDYNSELYSKVPPHNGPESARSTTQGWDHPGDTSSSCGSNSSPPMVGRSNGSSSGYSTGGEMSFTPKYKSQQTNSSSDSVLYTENNSATENIQAQSPRLQSVTHTSSVPIFALHPKGTFYIPLTIDATVIANDLVAFDDTLPLLHPVSISVNFCQSLKFLNKWQRHAYVPEIYEERCNSGERTTFATDAGHN